MRNHITFLLSMTFVPTALVLSMERELEKEERAKTDLIVDVSKIQKSSAAEKPSTLLPLRVPGGKWTLFGVGLSIAVGIVGGTKWAWNYVKAKNEAQPFVKKLFGRIVSPSNEEPTYFRDYQQILKNSIPGEPFFEQWNGYDKTPYDLIEDASFYLSLSKDQREKVLIIAKIFSQEYGRQELDTIFNGDAAQEAEAQKRRIDAFEVHQQSSGPLSPAQSSRMALLEKEISHFNEIYNTAVEGRFAYSRLDEMRELYRQTGEFNVGPLS